MYEHQRALTVVKVFLRGRGCEREEGIERRRERRKKKRLSPFFLFGVAIERAGDQVVNTCSASKYGSPTYLPSTAELEIVWYFLLDCWNLPKSIRSPGSFFQTGNFGSYRLPIFAHLLISKIKSIAE